MSNSFFRTSLIKKINQYYKETPTALRCIEYLREKYPFVLPTIDHIAYRFLNFENYRKFLKDVDPEFKEGGYLDFPLKKSDKYHKQAYWYTHDVYSRMFTSFIEIPEEDLKLIQKIKESDLNQREKYSKLKEIDQYMAWTTFWGESINHMAFDLSHYPDPFEVIMKEMSDDLKLEMNIFPDNNPRNPMIMVSKDQLLRQASTKADKVDGIPKAYIEFVSRSKDSEGHYREGFDSFSANGIFESTN